MKKIIISGILLLLTLGFSLAENRYDEPQPPDNKYDKVAWLKYYDKVDRLNRLSKTTALSHRRSGIHNGNRVRTLFYNYGSIGKPSTEPSMEWPIGSNRGYAFEFGVVAGGLVTPRGGDPEDPQDSFPIVSDGLVTAGVQETARDNTVAGDWQPLPGYHDPYAFSIAMSDAPDENRDGKPDYWPTNWYDPFFEDYVWPGEYGKGVTTADQESYFVMDDYYVKNHNSYWPSLGEPWSSEPQDGEFYPDSTDLVRGGLGLEVQARGYQWVSTRAQNVIFFVYELTNVGTDTLKGVYFGMYGDPHIGGANDYADDDAYYDTFLDMVYAWDDNAVGGPEFNQTIPGFFGYKFLESPGEPRDGLDNDEDGIIDESMQDDIDNDGDWRAFTDWNLNGSWDEGEPLNDDLGADGVGPEDPQYAGPDLDGSEANGMPDHGEPNFDETDLDEADQIGLTGFVVEEYTSAVRTDDYYYTQRLSATIIDSLFKQAQDNIFMYSSGPIVMAPNDTRRFSITMLFGYNTTGAGGEDLYSDPHNTRDLYATADVMQEIYNAGYRFVKPPVKPRVTAVAGDRQVTLYWDDGAERSRDPLYGNDFEGYVIYRATDFGFNEVLDITDAYGSPYLWKPVAKYDLDNHISGPHPIEQIANSGLHYEMGSNTGLVHSFVDKDVINGQRYFYAVCAYDSGSVRDTIPPTETAKNIQEDFSGQVTLDVNTAVVIPAAPSIGFVPPDIPADEQVHDGPGSGQIEFSIVDPTQVPDNRTYEVRFIDSGMDVVDNDGDWESFVDDTLIYVNGVYADLLVPPTLDSTIVNITANDSVVMRADTGDVFQYRGQFWQIKTYLEGGAKDTVVLYPQTLAIGPTMHIWDPSVDGSVFDDVGSDGCSDEYEDGAGGCLTVVSHAPGDDPNGDNWDPDLNPSGTEANGRPDTGEPDVDDKDLQEKMRETQSFSVWDITDPGSEVSIMEDQVGLHGEDINQISRGMQLFIHNDTLMVDEDRSGWTVGDCNWDVEVEVFSNAIRHGVASPKDYRFEFYDTIVDTSVNVSNLVDRDGKEVVFRLFDTIEEKYERFVVAALDDSTLTPGREVISVIYQNDEDPSEAQLVSWKFTFRSPVGQVESIMPTDDGVLLGTTSDGVFYYTHADGNWQNWTRANTGKGLLADWVNDIESIDGYYWMATSFGPSIFDGSAWIPNVALETLFDEFAAEDKEALEDPEKSKVYEGCSALAQDSEGWIWIGSYGSGLVRVNTMGTYETSQDDSIEVHVTPDSLDGDEFPLDITGTTLNDLVVDDNDVVWVATKRGVLAFDFHANTWTVYDNNNSDLPHREVRALALLDNGALAIGSRKGLVILKDSTMRVLQAEDGYLPTVGTSTTKGNSIFSLSFDPTDQKLYIGSQQGYTIMDLSAAGSDYSGTITSSWSLHSYASNTINLDSQIHGIAAANGYLYAGTEDGLEIRNPDGTWNSFGPQPGDQYEMKTRKPFSSYDTYQFTTHGGQEDELLVKQDLSEVAVVPNPYVASAVWERKPYLQSGRGERKVYFTNLPRECTIRIYTLSGELVRILEHHETVFNGQEAWDLLNADALEVAYGIYIFHVETDNAEAIGKFAVIK